MKRNISAEKKMVIKENLKKRTSFFSLDVFLPVAVCVILLIVYLRTLLPGVGYMGDTAKFQFIGKVLGIPHAPGYPNYILLNHFFVSVFPFGTLAFRANFLSALYTIIASLFIFKSMRLFNVNHWIAASITLTLCLGKTVWIQSVIAEVYSLNLLYTALVVYLFIKWHLSHQDRYFYLACFFYAISFGNHLIMITLLPGIIYLVWVTDRRAFLDPKKIFSVLLFILLGAGQYYYLIWRSLDPTSTYIELQANNLSELLNVVTGAGSRDDVFRILPFVQYLAKIEKFGFFFARELLFLIPMPFIGFFSKKRNSLYWFIAILFLSSLFFSYNYSIDDIWVYLIPCYYFLSIFTALGFERLYDWWVEKQKKPQIVYATVLIPLAFLFINFNRADMSRQNQSQLEVEADLAVIQQNAIIINPDYDNYEYFKYYLLGEDYEKKRNIHLMSEYEAQNYLADPENPYKVYAISQEEAEKFTQQGYSAVQVRNDLYQITK